jgi:E3 ubiquitin-protein ligase makorin
VFARLSDEAERSDLCLEVAVILQVCTHWLAGHCLYGDKCRYDHKRPSWAPRPEPSTSKTYQAPPAVPKPSTDQLGEVQPVSQLRLGGALARKLNGHTSHAASRDHEAPFTAVAATSTPSPQNSSPPFELPADPFGSGTADDPTTVLEKLRLDDSIPELPDDLGLGFGSPSGGEYEGAALEDYGQSSALDEATGLARTRAAGSAEGSSYHGDVFATTTQHYSLQHLAETGRPNEAEDYEYEHFPHQHYIAYDAQGNGEGYLGGIVSGTVDETENIHAEDHGRRYDSGGEFGGAPGSYSGSIGGVNFSYEGYSGHASSSNGDYAELGSGSGATEFALGTSPGGTGLPAWHIPSGGTSWNGSIGGMHDAARLHTSPALASLCYEYYHSGTCSAGEGCRMAHGDWCETCQRHALHPSDTALRESHVTECSARHRRLESLQRSANVECCICYERVLDKSAPGERKFGLLSCEHAFCLGCIRSWRQNVTGGVDVDSAIRTCPICRTPTHFITPSTIWPSTPQEKEAILAGYRSKLASIDCRHFNYGEGTCPFGTSCMYRHMYSDGRLEETGPRRVAVDEDEVRVVQPVRLSDFIVVNQGRVRGRRR